MRNSKCFTIRSSATLLSLTITMNLFAGAAAAQMATSTSTMQQPMMMQSPGAPVPTQIITARTVFLTNAEADANFPIDATQSYNDVYAALQAWGHYQMVGSPAEADLVFQLRDRAPVTGVYGSEGSVSSVTSPEFQLTILDPKTSVPLWTVTSPVNVLGNRQAAARWVGIDETNLVSRIKVLAGQPLSDTETADLTTYPKVHGKAVGYILLGGTLGLAAGAYLLAHHAFEDSLADQKASTDAFCTANHIPLSECAGG